MKKENIILPWDSDCNATRAVNPAAFPTKFQDTRKGGVIFMHERVLKIDFTGRKFGRLTVIGREENKNSRVMWLCICDCGKNTIVDGRNLKTGTTKSCGCLSAELKTKRFRKHYGIDVRLHRIWCGMRQRCFNANSKDFKNYGGRGVTICEAWERFASFREWALNNNYKENLTIERKNVNGNYEPSNCEWITNLEQANNKRCNIFITHNGETKTLAQWAEFLGVDGTVLKRRINNGYPLEKALSNQRFYTYHQLEFNGKKQTMKEWSRELGISYVALKARITTNQWSIERALTTPVKKRTS
ncbi:MAG: hypothetical protein PHQ35_09390 [Phycisphaerae bacterium]|nr:hypothetical protein [Phycisphaerae bacterium]